MLEYHLFKDYITENLCEERSLDVSDCEGMRYLRNQIKNHEEIHPLSQIPFNKLSEQIMLRLKHCDSADCCSLCSL